MGGRWGNDSEGFGGRGSVDGRGQWGKPDSGDSVGEGSPPEAHVELRGGSKAKGRQETQDGQHVLPTFCLFFNWAGSKSPRMRSRSMGSSFKGEDGQRGRACLWAQSQGRGGGEGRGCLHHPRGGREGPPAWPSPALAGQVGVGKGTPLAQPVRESGQGPSCQVCISPEIRDDEGVDRQ